MRNRKGHAKRQDAVFGVTAAFEELAGRAQQDRAEIEWVWQALKLDQLTAEQLQAVEYLVNRVEGGR